MPKNNFMISKAVDLVARKLAGMDADSVARLSQVLSEEAQMISEELQYNGQNVSSDVLAAKLEGLVARMKYAAKNQDPDPSPHEFPIFNVSHNPESPYPNPINHLYDKRYKEAYATYIKQNEPTPTNTPSPNAQKTTPTSPPPLSSQPKQPTPSVEQPKANANNPQYSQGQSQQQPFVLRQMPNGTWQYVNPYGTMPRSHTAHYQQQASKIAQANEQQQPQSPSANPTQPVRRSSTGDNIYSQSLSRSSSTNDLNYASNSGSEKIRVRVINDNSKPANNQQSIVRQISATDNIQDVKPARQIYAQPGMDIGTETMRDLFQIANNPRSDPSRPSSSSTAERVIIIDRRGPSGSDNNNSNSSGQDRYREFEIRATPPVSQPSTPSSPPVVTTSSSTAAAPTATPSSNAYAIQQPNYYAGQQMFYPQMKVYSSIPNNLYSAATPYVARSNNAYPYAYYRYN